MSFIDENYPQCLDNEYSWHCPCSRAEMEVDGKSLGFASRCWRVSENDQDLYVWGELAEEFAPILKEKLDEQNWYNEYTVIFGEF